MATTVADLSEERRRELAGYLSDFSPGHPADDHEALQYWEMIAEQLRREQPNRFSAYTNDRLVSMDAQTLLVDLVRRAFPLVKLKKLLEQIQCQRALNIFEDATTPNITRQPGNSVEVIESSRLVLEVKAECRPGQPVYQWFKERDPIVEQNKPTLVIDKIQKANSGHYTCRVTNPFINDQQKASVFSNCVKVTIAAGREIPSSNSRIQQASDGVPEFHRVSTPTITRHPFPITAHFNGRFELECLAEGATFFNWYKNNKFYKSSSPNGKLVFDRALSSDAGTYYCEAISSSAGKIKSQPAKVTVDMGITITKQPEGEEVCVNKKKFTLSCKATNIYGKKLKYEWFQKQPQVDIYQGEGEEFVGEVSAKRDVIYKFYCKVSLDDTPDVFVLSKVVMVTVKTVWITEQPRDVKEAIGNPAVLHCKAEGLGDITYTWFKADTLEGRGKPVRHGGKAYYFIRCLGQNHWGYYFCQAGNEYENAVSRRLHISACPPTSTALRRNSILRPPVIKFLRHPWSIVVPLGGEFRLVCKAVSSGNEQLFYQWQLNEESIRDETKQELIRKNICEEDFGSYVCFVYTNSTVLVSKEGRIVQSSDAPSRELASRSGQFDKYEAEVELKTRGDMRYAREKVALLIGNQRYENFSDLESPETDIRELSRVLEELSFKVISLVNLRYSEIMKALEVFYEMLAIPGMYALFYYSGHGFQTSAGRNYLVPVDADKPLQLQHNIYVEDIIGKMQRKLSRALIILDSCKKVVDKHVVEEGSLHSGSLPSLENMSNFVEIYSCVDNFTADDTDRGTVHSFFNRSLIEALESLKVERKTVHEVFQMVLKKFTDSDREQRPQPRGSFADSKISLADPVMIDNPQVQEKQLNKVLKDYNQAHTPPIPVQIAGEDRLGELAKLIRIEVEFDNEFSNVLCVVTKSTLLENGMKTATVKIDYDEEFIKAQFQKSEDVLVVQGSSDSCQSEEVMGDEEEEVGGQGEYESFFIKTLRVFNIQRLSSKTPKLKFLLTATVGTQGTDKVGKVTYEVPLEKHLLNN